GHRPLWIGFPIVCGTFSMLRLGIALGSFATLTLAQQPTGPHLVATRLIGNNPATLIVAVDPVTGFVSNRDRFIGDVLPPLAIALDPYDGHVLLAVDQGNGSSLLLRIVDGGATSASTVMAEIPGRVSQI